MEFEVLKRGHIKRNIIIGSFAVLLISAVILNFTRAKYRITADIPIASGTINYSLADLNVVAITVDGESVDTIPEGNYELTNESYCTIDGEQDDSIKLFYDMETQKLTVTPFTTKGTKCYLDFIKSNPAKETLDKLDLVVIEGTPNFNNTSCTDRCEEQTVGLYEETTSKGITYYFRGDVDNNYLVFADKYWRIIRINEDGSIRIIYSGEKATVDQAGKEKVLANGYNDYFTGYTQIQTSAFNSLDNRSEYVGFRYTEGSQRPNDTNSGIESTIKGVLDTWYSNNLQIYDSMIISTSGFCNDREMASGSSWSSQPSSNMFYKAYERLELNKTPIFDCINTNDLYQTKIGLITADEVAYAGGKLSTANYGYYLYTGNYYWTISPEYFASRGYAGVYGVGDAGYLLDYYVSMAFGVRPVINLSSNVTVTGSGTIADPYIVN